MDITSTKCRFRSSEAVRTRHTCHNYPVSARELWQLCLAYARYQSSFSLSLTKLSSVAPVDPPDFSILYHRARKTHLPHPALAIGRPHPDQDKAPARPARAGPGGLPARSARKVKQTNLAPPPRNYTSV